MLCPNRKRPEEESVKFSTLALAALFSLFLAGVTFAQTDANDKVTLFQNVRVFDGKSSTLSAPSNVLVRGNKIEKVSTAAIPTDGSVGTQIIDGAGRTLMPGLIDAHTHLMFASIPEVTILTADIGFVQIAAGKSATEMLMRGFTSVRDMGGPVFGLKRAIDSGVIPGPRIWPSGAFISQSGGHGDFRLPNELPAPPGYFSYSERIGGAAIADDPATVRKRAREQLALGASQIKMMAGGGISSHYDPLDVTQYTVEELRAGVEAAENWGTYVTVHAYTPRAVRQSIEAGVKCIDHGQLLDEPTVKLMADKGIWWSLQPFIGESRYPKGSPNRIKQLEMYKGTDTAYELAKKYHIKTAWGSDILFSAESLANQMQELTKLLRWYTPPEILKMATADNAELLALSGERSPYAGKLGVIEEGALADILLVDGDPITNIKVLEDSSKNILVIMKNGQIYKNTIAK
jgi:imidazolonepropionase-like amidohydrolase